MRDSETRAVNAMSSLILLEDEDRPTAATALGMSSVRCTYASGSARIGSRTGRRCRMTGPSRGVASGRWKSTQSYHGTEEAKLLALTKSRRRRVLQMDERGGDMGVKHR